MKLKLSVRTVNVFCAAFGAHAAVGYNVDKHGQWEFPDWLIEKIRAASPESMLKYRNCGAKTAKEMIDELGRHGVEIQGHRPWEKPKLKMICPHCGARIKAMSDLLRGDSPNDEAERLRGGNL